MVRDRQGRPAVAIIGPDREDTKELRQLVESLGLGYVVAESTRYAEGRADRAFEDLTSLAPDILLVDMNGVIRSVDTVAALHQQLPEAWILAVSKTADPSIILESVRAGAREFLARPVSDDSLQEAFGRFAAERARKVGRKRGKIFSITSAKGGAGATSVAINLAASAVRSPGTKIALLDLNSPLGDAAPYLDLKSEFTLANALEARDRLDSVLLDSFLSSTNGISVLPGPREYDPALLDPVAVRRILEVASETYTHTFIDLPSTHDPALLTAVGEMSSDIAVIFTPEIPALWRTHRLLDFFRQVHLEEKVRLVLNRKDKRTEITEKEMTKTLGRELFHIIGNDYGASIRAINDGRPLVTVNHSPLSRDYAGLCQRLTGLQQPQKKKGLFGFLN